jgi:hypothetical protein
MTSPQERDITWIRSAVTLVLAVPLSFAAASAAETGSSGVLELTVLSADKPCPCRVHLSDAAGKPVKAPGLPFWKDHFVCDGQVRLELPAGGYRYVVERGPEFRPVRGQFDVAAGEKRQVQLRLERIAHLAARGWWSGDLHVHRKAADIELLMAAEDLHVAPVMSWWHAGKWIDMRVPGEQLRVFPGTRYADLRAGEDERDGGALLFFHLDDPLPLKDASYTFPIMTASIAEARRQKPGAWIDIEKPFWWEVPLWLAAGEADSVGLANNHMNRSRMLDEEAWGRPRDRQKYPSPRGNGFYSQDLYYHILNCGLHLPPSAGSASGVLPNPVGYNRVYVQLDGDFNYDAWWKALRRGRSFVTNGPLLRCRANGHWSDHAFTAPAGGTVDITIDVELDSNDPVSKLEIIRNGQVASTHSWKPSARQATIGPVTFDRSGWFLVRAIADVDHTFRFASTAPWHVKIGDQPHISRASVQFFLDWLGERRAKIEVKDARHNAEILPYYDRAQEFWQRRLAEATAP